ncbi:MAG TPA: RIP metalloprotease RseP [Patescibacteria group bacterium]|nr:RIP metalloprotease RseP [Patescibacteria group bacterium]
MTFTIIIFLLVLGVLVFVHELGHFVVARKNGVKAEEFGFGFPPRVWGIYKNKENKWKQVRGKKEVKDAKSTIYSFNWIPLGGFVKIKGESGQNKEDKDSFAHKPVWRRALILVAGVVMNIILAGVLISVGYMIGFPDSTANLPKSAQVSGQQVQIVQIMPDSAAESADIKAGDVVVSVDGESIDSEIELQELIRARANEEVDLVLKRQDKTMNLIVSPDVKDNGQGSLGVAIVSSGIVKYPFFQSIWQGFKVAFLLLGAIFVAFFELIKNLFVGAPISAEIAGPIGIADMTGNYARMGFSYLLQFTALLSLNLAVINILPFPALDGGRILFLVIEKIKGSPVKQEVENVIHNLGFILLMLLVLLVTFKDVSRLFN